ncbi:MAG: metal ABC transporter permease [Syntrophorhabdaceae bacterium]|nr:metal ABC transporter permease [Syntrophorhabdaceae bacterium]
MDMHDLFTHGFIQRALITGFFIAILCSTLGVFLVLRNLSLIGDGLAHVTFGGVAIGLFFQSYPLYVALPIVMLSSLGILKLKEKAGIFGDTAIGIISSLGIATGIIIASIAGGLNIDIFSYLFGNILAINTGEMTVSIILSIGLMALIYILYQELVYISFDEDSARVSGIKVDRINTIICLMTALAVVLAMKAVGILLVTSLLILPAVTALQIARSFRMTLIISNIAGIFSVISGIIVSFFINLPAGATIVLINFIFFIFAFLYKNMVRSSVR